MKSDHIEFESALGATLPAKLNMATNSAGSKNKISSLNRALLIMHAPLDKTVGIDNAATLYSRARHPKNFTSLHQADHLLTDQRFSRYAGKIIALGGEIYF